MVALKLHGLIMKPWTKPENRMTRYPRNMKRIPWSNFIIVCKTEKDRAQIRAAMEYFHNMHETDTNFIVVNQLVHNYIHDDASDGHSDVIVDKEVYKQLLPRKHVKLTN